MPPKAQLIALDDRFGSKPDERGHRPGGPHLGVKQTKSGAKQTLPLEGLFSEVERSDRRVYGKELFSVELNANRQAAGTLGQKTGFQGGFPYT